jgi:hypothetical protein
MTFPWKAGFDGILKPITANGITCLFYSPSLITFVA